MVEKAGYQGPRAEYVPGEVIVKFKSGISAAKRNGAMKSVNAMSSEKIVTAAMKQAGDMEGITVVQTKLSVADAVKALNNSPEVEYAEPNYYYYHDATSNDTYYTNGSLWGMYGDGTSPANQYGSQAGEAWAAGNTGSSTVYVGVIDEGAQWAHEDLAGQIWTNQFDPVDGIDNDGNGYKDDTHGWDFDKNDNTTYDGTQDDHGTHVSGTIGGIGGNAKGVAGVNWAVKMITLKFLGRAGGTTANAIKAVDYLTDMKTRHGLNIVASNNSWGGGGFSQALQDAIERANTANILFCAAAGNGGSDGVGDNNDAVASYPSNYPNANIIAVASITSTGAKSSFSNYGATTVDIGAPGSGIYSTLPNTSGNKYGSYSGTSMATPHVTGACALYASTHAGASAATIKAAILAAAVPTASLSGKCVTGGRLNVSGF
ncbi:MAG: S8 family serine peptidase [Ignavibacteriae bacterium]|nr:S8 family serine peptidase [Ignavibacteriota bacterium]